MTLNKNCYCLDKKTLSKNLKDTDFELGLKFKERVPYDLWLMLVNMNVTEVTVKCLTCGSTVKITLTPHEETVKQRTDFQLFRDRGLKK